MPEAFDPNLHVDIRDDAFALRPDLAVHVATITSLWSVTEFLQGSLLAHIVKGDPGAAAALFSTLRSTAAQRQAVIAVVESTNLPEDIKQEIDLIFDATKNRSKERNAIIHALWGICEKYPKAIINCTTESFIKLHGNTHDFDNYQAETLEELSRKADTKISYAILDLKIYREHDFKQIIQRILALNLRFNDLLRKIKPERYFQETLFAKPPQPNA